MASLYGPSYWLRCTHSVHNLCVSAKALVAGISCGTVASDDRYVSVKVTDSLVFTLNSLIVVMSLPRSGAFVCNTTMSGPATARHSPFILVTHGVVRP